LPPTEILFYRDRTGRVPVRDWLQALRWRDRVAYSKCVSAIGRLAAEGHELRRPTAAHLRSGLHELRIHRGRVHLRILYFFHGRNVVVLAHGLTKEDVVPRADIHRALIRKAAYEEQPQSHTFQEEISDAPDH
jgi:phage-related protein